MRGLPKLPATARSSRYRSAFNFLTKEARALCCDVDLPISALLLLTLRLSALHRAALFTRPLCFSLVALLPKLEHARAASLRFLVEMLLSDDELVDTELAKSWISAEDVTTGMKGATVATTDILLKDYEDKRNIYAVTVEDGKSVEALALEASAKKLVELQGLTVSELCVRTSSNAAPLSLHPLIRVCLSFSLTHTHTHTHNL